MEKLYQEKHVNHIKQSGKIWKRSSPCFKITDLKLVNQPLSGYNTKIRLRTRIIKRIQLFR